MQTLIPLALLAAGVALPTAGKEVPEASSPADVRPGRTALVESEKGMHYFLRVPKSYRPKRGARVVVFLHGSNMNGLGYLRSFEAKGWCRDDILVCPNGEKGDDPYGANNFTFGSAPYVAGVTGEVKAAFRTTRVYVGGHSQGAFVTYSVLMHHPDLYQGAFPMAGDCWMQNEPNLWQDRPAILAKQRRIAIAVIHGRKDPVVSISQGRHAYDVYVVMGYPKIRLFAPEGLGHQFMLSPVGEALDWLDAMTGEDPKHILRSAARYVKEEDWGSAVQAARRLLELNRVPRSAKKQASAVLKLADKVAAKEIRALAKAMESEPAEEWLPKWYEFRRLFGGTKAAAKLVQKLEKQRGAQRAVGERLFREARGLFREGRKDEGHGKLRELLKTAPATYEAYYAVTWLRE